MGEQDDGNGWIYGLTGIGICIVFVMGMGVFSVVYYGRGSHQGRYEYISES